MISNGIENDWGLLPVARPEQRGLQKRLIPHLPSQERRGSIAQGKHIEIEPNIRWEKGLFIDIYA